MRILVLGATGGTGREFILQAMSHGHRVTALVRSPEKLAAMKDSIDICTGDVTSVTQLSELLRGQDAVVSALGHRGFGRSSLLADTSLALIPAMRTTGVSRIVLVSVGLLFADAGFFADLARRTFLRNVVADSAAMETIVAQSGMDWTIARPPLLTNGPRTLKYEVADGMIPDHTRPWISRADVADFLLQEVEHPAHERQFVGMGKSTASGINPIPVRTTR